MGGKNQSSSPQKGVSHTYTLRLGQSRNSNLYKIYIYIYVCVCVCVCVCVAIAFMNYRISIVDHLVCLNSFLHISRPAAIKKLTIPFHALLDLRLMPLCRKIRVNFRKNKALGTSVKVFRLIRFMCYLVLTRSYSVYMEPWKAFFNFGLQEEEHEGLGR